MQPQNPQQPDYSFIVDQPMLDIKAERKFGTNAKLIIILLLLAAVAVGSIIISRTQRSLEKVSSRSSNYIVANFIAPAQNGDFLSVANFIARGKQSDIPEIRDVTEKTFNTYSASSCEITDVLSEQQQLVDVKVTCDGKIDKLQIKFRLLEGRESVGLISVEVSNV